MQFTFENTKPNITNDDIIADLKRVASNSNSLSLSQRVYREHGLYSTTMIKNRFGTWNAAISAAKLDANIKKDVTVEDLFDNLRTVWIALGRQPRKREMINSISRFTHHPYSRRFGGWLNAVKAFVSDVNKDVQIEFANNVSSKIQRRGPREPSLRIRFLVMHRDNFKCRCCGRSPTTNPSIVLHIDHITSWSKGGETTIDNLQTLCQDCNLGKSNLTVK